MSPPPSPYKFTVALAATNMSLSSMETTPVNQVLIQTQNFRGAFEQDLQKKLVFWTNQGGGGGQTQYFK